MANPKNPAQNPGTENTFGTSQHVSGAQPSNQEQPGPPAGGHQPFENSSDAVPPPAAELHEKDAATAEIEADRKIFKAAFIRNHEWDEKKLSAEQLAEIESHPFWNDPAKLHQAVQPATPIKGGDENVKTSAKAEKH